MNKSKKNQKSVDKELPVSYHSLHLSPKTKGTKKIDTKTTNEDLVRISNQTNSPKNITIENQTPELIPSIISA